mmetsp:Transcript_104025/g.291463  ORF Transcript_104025/g.291463 Transcript_104025/m.291463 type:complete len:81 (+) Transcript_104025:1205-1447(+)
MASEVVMRRLCLFAPPPVASCKRLATPVPQLSALLATEARRWSAPHAVGSACRGLLARLAECCLGEGRAKHRVGRERKLS